MTLKPVFRGALTGRRFFKSSPGGADIEGPCVKSLLFHFESDATAPLARVPLTSHGCLCLV